MGSSQAPPGFIVWKVALTNLEIMFGESQLNYFDAG